MNGPFSRIFINEESIEEEDHNSGDQCRESENHRSFINEDKERRGEMLSEQNVSPHQNFGGGDGSLNTSVFMINPTYTPPSGFIAGDPNHNSSTYP